MEKLTIGTRVETPYGEGSICGYDLEYSRAWRHQVKLDNGKLWNKNNPCFYHNQIKPLLKPSLETFNYVTCPHEIRILDNDKRIVKIFEYSREEHFDNLHKAINYTNYLNRGK